MKPNKQAYALVTGAYTGIGLGICEALAKRGYNLLMVARNEAALQKEANRLELEHGVRTEYFAVDLSDTDAPQRIFDWTRELGVTVQFLCNNAGIGMDGKFHEREAEQIDKVLSVNVRAVTLLTRAFMDDVRSASPGYILNVASMARYYPMPYKAVYASTKAFVYHFTRSLAVELEEVDVYPSVMCAGPVPTTNELKERIKKSSWFGRTVALEPGVVGEATVRDALRGKEVILPGFVTKLGLLVLHLAPAWARRKKFLKTIEGQIGVERERA